MMEVYTHTATDSPFYTLPPDCTEIVSVQTLRYSGDYQDIDFINITKGEKLVGFSTHILFDSVVEKGIKVIYK